MDKPLFSIVTINRNNATGLLKTLERTFAQTCRDYEQIVIDGASTDTSPDIIRQYSGKLAYSVSEPDSGIYNAMNKGLRAAKGKYLIFMNSGDCLWNPYVLEAFEETAREGSFEILYGDYVLDKLHGSSQRIVQPEKLELELFNPPASWGIRHQSLFYRSDLVEKLGGYDESYKIAADWKFTLRALVEFNASQSYLPIPVAFYDYTGISSQHDHLDSACKEARKACAETIPQELWRKMQLEAHRIEKEREKQKRRKRPPLRNRCEDFLWRTAKRLAMATLKGRKGQ